jgi:hypothetical protein
MAAAIQSYARCRYDVDSEETLYTVEISAVRSMKLEIILQAIGL